MRFMPRTGSVLSPTYIIQYQRTLLQPAGITWMVVTFVGPSSLRTPAM
jgi:hypothetical protein